MSRFVVEEDTRPVLLIDVSNMAHRAFHTTGGLSFNGDMTGILYGIFRDIVEFRELFNASKIAFCFDGGHDHRTKLYQKYKADRVERRQKMDEDELEARRELRKQVYRLRTSLLNDVGFRNIFWQEGYEADDIIAWIAENHWNDFVIVSTDQDLYQCLVENRITIWNPITKRTITEKSFTEKYGIVPMLWANVKAIAGCSGDNVPGIKGIGEKTAAKFMSGKLKPTSKAFIDIISNANKIDRNFSLVKLPFPGCGPFELEDDDVTPRTWDKMMDALGMRSLMGRR